jgi:hypothetical protein
MPHQSVPPILIEGLGRKERATKKVYYIGLLVYGLRASINAELEHCFWHFENVSGHAFFWQGVFGFHRNKSKQCDSSTIKKADVGASAVNTWGRTVAACLRKRETSTTRNNFQTCFFLNKKSTVCLVEDCRKINKKRQKIQGSLQHLTLKNIWLFKPDCQTTTD